MNRNEILERLDEVFADVFDEESLHVTEKTTAADIEAWDSLTHITLIAEVENAFDMKFSMKEVLEMKDIGEMVDIIQREA